MRAAVRRLTPVSAGKVHGRCRVGVATARARHEGQTAPSAAAASTRATRILQHGYEGGQRPPPISSSPSTRPTSPIAKLAKQTAYFDIPPDIPSPLERSSLGVFSESPPRPTRSPPQAPLTQGRRLTRRRCSPQSPLRPSARGANAMHVASSSAPSANFLVSKPVVGRHQRANNSSVSAS